MREKLIAGGIVLCILIYCVIAAKLSIYLYENYGIDKTIANILETVLVLFIAYQIVETRSKEIEEKENVLDGPSVMDIDYKPLTRVVYSTEKHSTWVMECDYELDVPIGTIFEHGHFKYRVTHFHTFCSGEGRVYYTEKL